MAKCSMVAAAFVALLLGLCFTSLLSLAHARDDSLYVEGMVYCDTCRVEFATPLAVALEGATVKLVCRARENSTVTYELEGQTDKAGRYSLPVEGDHEEEICEVRLVKSPREDCSEAFKSADSARVLLTKNVGVVEPARFANALGFMKPVALPECGKVLEDMGFLPLEETQA